MALKTYNQFHNILRLFDVLLNFPFTTSETMCDYSLQKLLIRGASQVAEQLKRLPQIRKYQENVQTPQSDRLVPTPTPLSPLPKLKFYQHQQQALEKQKLNPSRSGPRHAKIRTSLRYYVNNCRLETCKQITDTTWIF